MQNIAAAILNELRHSGLKTRDIATALGVSTKRLEKAEKSGATDKVIREWVGMLRAIKHLDVKYKIHPDGTVWVGITEI